MSLRTNLYCFHYSYWNFLACPSSNANKIDNFSHENSRPVEGVDWGLSRKSEASSNEGKKGNWFSRYVNLISNFGLVPVISIPASGKISFLFLLDSLFQFQSQRKTPMRKITPLFWRITNLKTRYVVTTSVCGIFGRQDLDAKKKLITFLLKCLASKKLSVEPWLKNETCCFDNILFQYPAKSEFIALLGTVVSRNEVFVQKSFLSVFVSFGSWASRMAKKLISNAKTVLLILLKFICFNIDL